MGRFLSLVIDARYYARGEPALRQAQGERTMNGINHNSVEPEDKEVNSQ